MHAPDCEPNIYNCCKYDFVYILAKLLMVRDDIVVTKFLS